MGLLEFLYIMLKKTYKQKDRKKRRRFGCILQNTTEFQKKIVSLQNFFFIFYIFKIRRYID